MYCSPHLSTTWEEEINQHGPYNIIGKEGEEPPIAGDTRSLYIPDWTKMVSPAFALLAAF
jgi:hypothetical protein